MSGWIKGAAGAPVSVRIPLLTVHGLTEASAAYVELMYHSDSPVSEPPFAPLNGYWVIQVPDVPFHRFNELNSSSNVIVAVADRLFGSRAILHTSRVACLR